MPISNALVAPILALATAHSAYFLDENAAIASSLLEEVQSLRWGQALNDWRAAHPKAPIRAFQGNGAWLGIEDHWCYQAPVDRGDMYFYAFPGEPAPVCRLQQYIGSVKGLPPDRLRLIHRLLDGALTTKLGPPEAPERVNGFGSAYWANVLRWRTPQQEILLFLDCRGAEKPAPQKVTLIARGRRLVDAIAMEYRGELDRHPQVVPAIDADLARAVEPLVPDAATFLKYDWSTESIANDKVLAAIEKLLKVAEGLPLDQKPVALLSADRLAEKLAPRLRDSHTHQNAKAIVEKMNAMGLQLWWNELGAIWSYPHPLLWRVWRNYPDTPWGEWAFLALLESGWHTELCDGPKFHDVIREGEAYLRKHPASRHRARIWFMLGMANETWWSLSQASPRDPYVIASEFAEGSQEARERAIHYYRKAISALPGTQMDLYAQWHLPRLELGLDTNSRPYFCVYD